MKSGVRFMNYVLMPFPINLRCTKGGKLCKSARMCISNDFGANKMEMSTSFRYLKVKNNCKFVQLYKPKYSEKKNICYVFLCSKSKCFYSLSINLFIDSREIYSTKYEIIAQKNHQFPKSQRR